MASEWASLSASELRLAIIKQRPDALVMSEVTRLRLVAQILPGGRLYDAHLAVTSLTVRDPEITVIFGVPIIVHPDLADDVIFGVSRQVADAWRWSRDQLDPDRHEPGERPPPRAV